MLVLIFVITAAGAEGTHPPCLISGLIFHFIAHLSISNNTNGSICMTGFVTWRIRCQTRLNITPAHYHNQPSNECGRWCERLGWIREKGLLHAAQRGVSDWGIKSEVRSLWPWQRGSSGWQGSSPVMLTRQGNTGHTHTHTHTHTHQEDWRGELLLWNTQTAKRQHLRTAYSCVSPALNTNVWGHYRRIEAPAEWPQPKITTGYHRNEATGSLRCNETLDQTSFAWEGALTMLSESVFFFPVYIYIQIVRLITLDCFQMIT